MNITIKAGGKVCVVYVIVTEYFTLENGFYWIIKD